MYEKIIEELKKMSVPFVETAWATRPSGDFGVYSIDYEQESLIGDDVKVQRSWRGSVDLFLHKPDKTKIQAVETALTKVCGGSWEINSIQFENETRLTHYEFVFWIEEI